MSQSAENAKLRGEALRLLQQVERQGLDIAEAYRKGAVVSTQVNDFRRFIEKVDHFYVFVDLVEERLPRFEDEKRQALERHLAEIRWRIIIVEVDTTQIFLVRIGETNKPWPLGSREFLERRLGRFSEIADYYDQFGEKYHLSPLSEAMVRAVEELLKAQIERAPGLDDFTPVGGRVSPAVATGRAQERMTLRIDSGARRRRAAELERDLVKAPPPFRVRQEISGRFYVERDGIVAVTEACKRAAMNLDQLADRLGVSRPTLVLMLNGSDPIARGPLDQLRDFLAQHGGAAA